MTSRTTTARRVLDARLAPVRPLAHVPRPPRGWIRAIREALGMPSTELARRMGVVQSRVSRIERAEANGAIQVETLRRAAEALGCDFVYFIVPRKTLEQTVHDQARAKAAATLRPVAHNMRLEDQAVEGLDQIEDLASELTDRRGLWSNPPE